MLGSIELVNYRGFKYYRLARLSRVNLLVGKNNCGKTSVLEAVHLVASGGDPWVLISTALQRGEVIFLGEDRERYRRNAYPDISHFFHGHQFGPDAYFSVRTDDGLGGLTVRVLNVADLEEQATLFQETESARSGLAIRFEGAQHPLPRKFSAFPLTEEGTIPQDLLRRYGHLTPRDREATAAVQFITPDSLEPRSMSEMWDRVIIEGREAEVIEAMRILEPHLSGVFFLSGESAYRFGGRAGVLVAFEGARRRDPLGSYGEGMRRLLALSLSLIRAEGGVLLVDEIDTGLHYSIIGDMWRLIIEAAKRAGVQVFATTHSWDCVRGLAWLCENHPDLRTEISLQKIDCELEEAVGLGAEQIVLAVNQGMEVR